MRKFRHEYIIRLRALQSYEDVRDLYEWLWRSRSDISLAVQQMNQELKLEGPQELKPDLPCLAVGERTKLLIVALNPGWHPADNARENEICCRSPADYLRLMSNYFDEYPKQIRRIRWWSLAMSFIPLVRGQTDFGLVPKLTSQQKWHEAHEKSLLGGWEVFPFHSTRDGLTRYIPRSAWLREMAHESLRAAARMHPEVLFIASNAGWNLVRHDLWKNLPWNDEVLNGTTLSYCPSGKANPEIVAISSQLSAPRRVKNSELLLRVRQNRAACELARKVDVL